MPVWKVGDDADAIARSASGCSSAPRAIPGAEGAAFATGLPALHFPPRRPFDIAGRDATTRDRPTAGAGRRHRRLLRRRRRADRRRPGLCRRPTRRRRGGHRGVARIGAPLLGRRGAGDRRRDSPGRPSDGRPALEATVVGVARDTANADIDQAAQPVLFLLDEHRPTRAAAGRAAGRRAGGPGPGTARRRSATSIPTCRPTNCGPRARASPTRTRRTCC